MPGRPGWHRLLTSHQTERGSQGPTTAD